MKNFTNTPALTSQAELALCHENVAALTAALCEAARTIDELIENSPAVIHIKDLDGKFIQVNKKFEEIVGLPRTAVVGRTVFEVYPPTMAKTSNERDLDVIRSAKPVTEETVVEMDLGCRIFLDVKFPLFDANGAVRGTAGIATEITEQKRMEDALVKLAYTDVLTGLPNRRCFFERLAQEFDRGRRYAHPLALLCFDLDHFKAINDLHGHAGGDMVLRNVAGIFLQTLRSTDMAGRLGGEEFAIFMPETGAVEAAEVSERLRCMISDAAMCAPSGEPMQVTTSVGITCTRAEDTHHEMVLARADAALYKAKSEGRNRVCLDV